jgi:hypothetical protein
MITLTAKINLLEGDNSALRITSISNSKNNISSEISSVVGSKNLIGGNPFILGTSKLGKNKTFSSGENFYIGNISSDDNGNFSSQYNIVITGSKITNLTFVFDTENNGYPKDLYWITSSTTEQEYKLDDPIFTLAIQGGEVPSLKIRRPNWSVSNSPFVLQALYAELSIDIDTSNLISINAPFFDRADISLPSFGVISNKGSLSFNDKYGEIEDYIADGLLKENQDITMSLNNTLSKTSQTVGIAKTVEWNYDNDNRVVDLSFKDNLEEWQDIFVEGINYDPRNPQSKTGEYYYNYLYGKTPSKYNMQTFDELDTVVKNKLKGFVVPYPLLNDGNLWQQWNKLCQACFLNIYKQTTKTVCKSS